MFVPVIMSDRRRISRLKGEEEMAISFGDLCKEGKTLEYVTVCLHEANKVLNLSSLEIIEDQLGDISSRLLMEGRQRELRAEGRDIWKFRWSWHLYPKRKGGRIVALQPSHLYDYQAEALDDALKHKWLFTPLETPIPPDGHFSVLNLEAVLRPECESDGPRFEVRFVNCPSCFEAEHGIATLDRILTDHYSPDMTPEEAVHAVFDWYDGESWDICDSAGPQYLVLKTYSKHI